MATAAAPVQSQSSFVELGIAIAASALTLIGLWLGFGLVILGVATILVLFWLRNASPAGQVAFLMVAIQLNIFTIEFGDRVYNYESFYTLRPATPSVVILLAMLLWRLLNRKEKLGYLPAIKPILLLGAAYLIATLMHPSSPFFFRGLITCALLTIDVGVFVLFVRQLQPDRKLIDRAARWLIALYTIYALAGILMVLANLSGLDPHDYLVQNDTLSNYTMESAGGNAVIPRPWSFEPNTGSQMAAICLLALGKAMQRDERNQQLLWLCAAIIFVGVMLSFSRGAWVGLAAGILLLPFGARYVPRKRRQQRASLLRILAVPVTTVLGGYFLMVWLFPYLKDVLIGRFLTLLMWGQGTMAIRYQYWLMLIADGLGSPIFGRGASAYRGIMEAPYVPESFLIETFHSAGLLGVAAFFWLQLYLFRRGLRMLKNGLHLEFRWIMPLVVAYAGYFVSVQTNPNAWSAFYWMFLALLVASLFQERQTGWTPLTASASAGVLGETE